MSGLLSVPNCPFKNFRNKKGPLIDIRSPKEYSQGHWPGATNIPLFTDKEREIIGIAYKKEGSKKAISKGIKLVIPKLKSLKCSIELLYKKEIIKGTSQDSFHLRFYCWRGGMRSRSVVWLSNHLGIPAIQLNGGYKSYRKWVLKEFEKSWPIKLIGGKTGAGKTELLLSLSNKNISIIDLEGLANHRGSSFGGLGLPLQPSCEQYENLIAESLNYCVQNSKSHIWLEDESPNLGKCRIPNNLVKQMRKADVLEIVKTKEERIQQLIKVYSNHSQSELEDAVLRITKRLGPERTKLALNAIRAKDWSTACSIILEYYDKCYDHQLKKVSKLKTIDISYIDNNIAADRLIKDGLIY
tara:strand:- start:9933 stop:10997 length:1065 start_codon:yes stop_codon:yes gene_type:complete